MGLSVEGLVNQVMTLVLPQISKKLRIKRKKTSESYYRFFLISLVKLTHFYIVLVLVVKITRGKNNRRAAIECRRKRKEYVAILEDTIKKFETEIYQLKSKLKVTLYLFNMSLGL